MKAARFSLAALLLWTAMIAVGCQALVSHTPLWASIVVTATTGMFGIALLFSLVHRGGTRAYLLGFLAAGGGYLLLACNPLAPAWGESLLTTRLLVASWSALGEAPPQQTPMGGSSGWSSSVIGDPDEDDYGSLLSFSPSSVYPAALKDYARSKRSFLLIGQCLWAVLLAFPAGLFCCWLCERRLKRDRAEISKWADKKHA